MLNKARAGFSLVELLVAIAIIGGLVSVLLPAVQAAREAARRMECTNHLRQLALAVVNYESAHKVLPASGIVRAATAGPYSEFKQNWGTNKRDFSWIVLVLPFFEEQSLWDQFDFSVSIYSQPKEPQKSHLSTLHCPSDQAQERDYFGTISAAGKTFAKGNYAAYVSPMHVELQAFFPGALIAHRPHKLKHISDGPSHTMMISEVRTIDHPQDERGVWSLPWCGSSLLAVDAHAVSASHAWPVEGRSPPPFVYDEAYAANPVDHPPQMPNAVGTPGAQLSDVIYPQGCTPALAAEARRQGMPCEEIGSGYWSGSARSMHPGGVLTAYMDGRVEFTPNEINDRVYVYAISSNDGRFITE